MARREVVPNAYKFVGKPKDIWPRGTHTATWGDN